MPFTILTGDTFTSTGAGVNLVIPSSADYVKVWNITQLSNATATACVSSEWFGPKFGLGQSAANDGIRWTKAGSNAILIDKFSNSTASNGFTYVTSVPYVEPQAANAITAITAASPAVVTQTNTYSEGDFVRIYNTTGMLQIAGMVFQISSVSGSGYTLTGLRAAGFAAPATAGNTRRVSKFNAVDPEYLYVTAISQATQAVVTCSVDPTPYYVVGMEIKLTVPSSFGMTQMNQVTGKILAVSATNYTLTIDVDSSAFTAFAFPASSASPTAQLFATLAPAGASTQFNQTTGLYTGYDVAHQAFRTAQEVPYLFLAGGAASPAGANLDQINWIAYKLEN